jgi:hypothetical protein
MAASTVSRLESGARRLTLDHLPPLAGALGVTVGLGAVDGPAEALAIFGPQGERIHTR